MAGWFRDLGFDGARRGPHGMQRDGEADVEGTPWHIECKVGKRPNPRAALKQAEEATDGRPVVVVMRDNQAPGSPKRDWVAMPWSVFVGLLIAFLIVSKSLTAEQFAEYLKDLAK